MVSVRRFQSPYIVLGRGICPAVKKLDPCLSTSIYAHPICIVGQKMKIRRLKQNGFWMMQESCNKQVVHFSVKRNDSASIDIYRCKPVIFNDSFAEKEFEKCMNDIAWTK